jgi:uncharacterized membrane protein
MTVGEPKPDIESSIWIGRPSQEIWSFLADIPNETQWRSGLIEAKWTSDPPYDVGSTALYVFDGVGDWPWTITELEEPRIISWDVTGGRFEGAHGGYQITPEGSGSHLTNYARMKRSAFMKIFLLVMKPRIKRQFDGDLERLKAIMEA